MLTKRYAGIGSREAPPEVLEVTRWFAFILAHLGYKLNSGGCPLGMDKAFLDGAYKCKRSDKSENHIFLSWNGMSNLYHDPANGFIDATKLPNYQQAHDLGLAARGSWERAGKGGIMHHSRNPYQVLDLDLNSPVDFVACWAPPSGKKGNVKGGTATAVKIAIEHNIPIYNFHDPVLFDRVRYFVNTYLASWKEKRIKETARHANPLA